MRLVALENEFVEHAFSALLESGLPWPMLALASLRARAAAST